MTEEDILMSNDIYLKGMTQEEGGVSMQLEGSPLHIIAASIIEQFKGIGADNYLEIKFNEKDTQELFTLTVQKASGVTPADKVAELTAELSDERERASYYQNELFKVTQEKNELIAQAASGLEYSTLLHNQIVGNQAAAIASISAQASSIGMRWVINQLTGPGHMNDVFEAIDNGVSAQDFYDKNCLEFLTRDKAIEKVKSINKPTSKVTVIGTVSGDFNFKG